MTRFASRALIRRFLLIQFCAWLAASLVLLAGWANATELACKRVPLTQSARPGETVLVCEPQSTEVRPAPSPARRSERAPERTRPAGVTTVVHYGHRAPVCSITCR